jgi:hypothetical protein
MIEHIPKAYNEEANKLAPGASGYRQIYGAIVVELAADEWKKEIADYLRDPSKKVDGRLRYRVTKYVLLEDELCY